jgi:hypothetical protein
MPSTEIAFENYQALAFVQSALGAVSENFRSLSIACSTGEVDLYYVLEVESSEDREEIDDIEAEMYSHQVNGSVLIRSHVKVFAGPRDFSKMIVGRAIYLRKEGDD